MDRKCGWTTLLECLRKHRYSDDQFEYRHVQLPKNMLKKIPADYFDSSKGTLKLLWEDEWRALGITQVCGACWKYFDVGFLTHTVRQSLGWEHYEVHEPEPHILLFKSASPILPLSSHTNEGENRRPLNYQPPISQ